MNTNTYGNRFGLNGFYVMFRGECAGSDYQDGDFLLINPDLTPVYGSDVYVEIKKEEQNINVLCHLREGELYDVSSLSRLPNNERIEINGVVVFQGKTRH